MKISVIVGSTRQGRFSEKPAEWILQQLQKREGIEGRLLDLRDFPMPFFDQPMPPAMPGRPPYEHEVVKKWTAQIVASDGFVFVTPEYNYGTSRGTEKRDRLGLSGVEPQGCRVCELRKRHGCASRPAASRDGSRDSDGACSVVRSHPGSNALGAFPGRRRGEGPRRVGEASERHDRRSALVDGSTQDCTRALTEGG